MRAVTRFFTSVLAAAVLMAGAVSTAGSAQAGGLPVKRLKCNAHVKQSVKLKADVGPCPGNAPGLQILADNITLDLGGHKVIGSGGTMPGIHMSGRSGVTVRNGTITKFNHGVGLGTVKETHLKALKIVGNVYNGVMGVNVTDSSISSSRVLNNGLRGLQLQGLDGVEIKKNVVRGNQEAGIMIHNSGPTLLQSNRVNKNNDGITASDSAWISLSKNRANKNRLDGIRLSTATGHFLSNNVAHYNGFVDGVGDQNGRGINAPNGTLGEDNTAKGNDNPIQCTPAYLCS